jgi:hypothetical protein
VTIVGIGSSITVTIWAEVEQIPKKLHNVTWKSVCDPGESEPRGRTKGWWVSTTDFESKKFCNRERSRRGSNSSVSLISNENHSRPPPPVEEERSILMTSQGLANLGALITTIGTTGEVGGDTSIDEELVVFHNLHWVGLIKHWARMMFGRRVMISPTWSPVVCTAPIPRGEMKTCLELVKWQREVSEFEKRKSFEQRNSLSWLPWSVGKVKESKIPVPSFVKIADSRRGVGGSLDDSAMTNWDEGSKTIS